MSIQGVTAQQALEEALLAKSQQLDARVNELQCIMRVSQILEDGDLPLGQMMEEVAAAIATRCQHPGTAAVRIQLRGQEFRSEGFRKTPWRMSANITVQDEIVGRLDVYRLLGPARTEERKLLGLIAGRIGHVVDRKEHIARLDEANRRLEEAQRMAHIGDWGYYRASGKFSWSDQVYEMCDRDPALGPPSGFHEILSLYDDESAEIAKRQIEIALCTGQTQRYEVRVLLPSGRVVFHALKAEVVRDEQGHVTGLRGVVQDVTERKALETSLRRKTQELEELNASLETRVRERTVELEESRTEADEANRAKSLFLANMSHEIRTPMNAILGFTQLLQRDEHLDERSRGYLETIDRSGEHLMTLLNGILEMAKIEAGRLEAQYDVFDGFGTCHDMAEIFRPRAREKGLSLALDWDPAVPRLMESDPQKVREVLHNLLSNAIKFTDHGSVMLRVRHEGLRVDGLPEQIRFEVIDTGCGIAEDQRAEVFEMFSQARCSRPKYGGTGLGLSISRSYASLLEGELRVDSRLGQGSTFCLSIPYRPVSREHRPERAHSSKRLVVDRTGPPPVVLAVDDVEDNLTLAGEFLRMGGFEPLLAESAARALEILDQRKPAIMLVDLRMPDVDGFELARLIRGREEGKSTRLIAVSASAQQDVRERALCDGFDGYLSKPVDGNQLIQTVAELIGLPVTSQDLPPTCNDPLEDLSPALASLSADFRRDLWAAAEQCDRDRLCQLAVELSEEHPGAAKRIRSLSDDFQYALISSELGLPPQP